MASTLYEFYTSLGKKLPKVSERAPIFEQYGLGKAGDYTGTEEQNIALLKALQKPTPDLQGIQTQIQGIAGATAAESQRRGVPLTPEFQRAFGESIPDLTKRMETQSPTYVPPPTPPPKPSEPTSYDASGKPIYSPLTPTPTPPVQTSETARATALEKFKAELNPSIGKPTFSNADEYKKLYDEKGEAKDQEELLAIQNEARQGQEEFRQFKATSGSGMTQAGFLGGVSEAEKNLSFRLEGLAIREKAIVDRLNVKNAYISNVLNLKQEDYSNALKNYEFEYNKNLKAVQLYNDQLSDEKKDSLTIMTTVSNLLKDKNIDYANLDPTIKTQLESFGLKLGIPGIFEAVFSATPDDKILTPILSEDKNTAYFFTQNPKTGDVKLKQAIGLDAKQPIPEGPNYLLNIIRQSKGGKKVDSEALNKFQKALLVLGQLETLQTDIKSAQTGPILGILRSANPYDVKAQLIKAELQAIVPNLARGVYGEVGVLTDNDVALYSRTLPNLKSLKSLRNAIMGMTLRTVQRGIETQLEVQAAAGRDVSGFETIYSRVREQADRIEKSITAPTLKVGSQVQRGGRRFEVIK